MPPITPPTTAPTGKAAEEEEDAAAYSVYVAVVVITTVDSVCDEAPDVVKLGGEVTTKKSIHTRLP